VALVLQAGTGPVRSASGAPSEGLREAVASRVLSAEGDAALVEVVQQLALAARGSLDGLVFFGSRRSGAARADAWSAYDLFVLVHRYRPFYEAMREAGLSGKRPGVLALLSRWLPPTQYSIRFEAPPVHVKAAVIRTDTFHRETSPARRDHFCIGRLFQPSRIVYARDRLSREALVDDLVSAHAETWGWSRPWLPAGFDAPGYGCNALRVSMSWEVRAEPPGRAEALWEAQRAEQTPVFGALLGGLAERGEVVPAPGAEGLWSPARTASRAETLRLELYFRRSMIRATVRWLKHTLSFEGWLEYILRKAQRHGGEPIELTARERRWPWIFLWPRVLRYLRARRREGSPP
jgi:hypothetical protein